MKQLLLLLSILIFSCEGPTGPEGPEGIQGKQGMLGEQGEQGEQGISKIIFNHNVILTDYYQSNILLNIDGDGVWMVGIEHDSIRMTSDINVYVDFDSVQVWQPLIYAAEIREGKFGLYDPNVSWYPGRTLRIIVIN